MPEEDGEEWGLSAYLVGIPKIIEFWMKINRIFKTTEVGFPQNA